MCGQDLKRGNVKEQRDMVRNRVEEKNTYSVMDRHILTYANTRPGPRQQSPQGESRRCGRERGPLYCETDPYVCVLLL